MPELLTSRTVAVAKVLILALILSVGLSYVFAAWSGPLSAPPNCISGNPGCDAPINVGATLQQKPAGGSIGAGTLFSTLGSFGTVGIGTAAPDSKLEINTIGDGTVAPPVETLLHLVSTAGPRIFLDSFGTTNNISGRRANGSGPISFSALASGDVIFSVNAFGAKGPNTYTGGPGGPRASIRFNATQNWTPTNQGTSISFLTTPNNSSALTEQVTINKNGTGELRSVGDVCTDAAGGHCLSDPAGSISGSCIEAGFYGEGSFGYFPAGSCAGSLPVPPATCNTGDVYGLIHCGCEAGYTPLLSTAIPVSGGYNVTYVCAKN